ncbi:MAG: substrate-binding domain-containing protein [Phycicoccus sp.]|nr:substrate-binding domain-containing protein [Phycicoccus sp.]
MTAPLVTGLSSMATRDVLSDLALQVSGQGECRLTFASAGGVEVARRVRDGEVVDLLVLAADALASLDADGLLVGGTIRSLFGSQVVWAGREGESAPDISSVSSLRAALASDVRVGYSTGPSGDGLMRHLETWGLREAVADRLVQAPPGVPVGSLLLTDVVDLAVQQRSELTGVAGVRILGPMPPGAELDTVFAGAVLTRSPDPDRAHRALQALADPRHSTLVARRGLVLLPAG